MTRWDVIEGDCVASMSALPSGLARCCVTSPPYFGLRDYGHEGQIGLEPTPAEYVAKMVAVFREVRRVLADDGTLWLNLGDSYAGRGATGGMNGCQSPVSSVAPAGCIAPPEGLKHKDLMGIPWRVAFALQDDGWYLRSDIIWHKPNPMPESVTDRPTKAHEYLFLLSKSRRYHYDAEAISEPIAASSVARLSQANLAAQAGSDRVPGKTNGNMKAVGPRFGGSKYGDDGRAETRTKSGNVWTGAETRNARTVWTIATRPFKGAHFAVFPEELADRCVLAGSTPGDTVMDPFGGSGTVGVVAAKRGRSAVLCELNPAYAEMARERIASVQPGLGLEAA